MSNIDYEQLYVESCRNQRDTLFTASHDHEKRITKIEVRQELEEKYARERHSAIEEETAQQDAKLKEHETFKIKALFGLAILAGGAKLIYDKINIPI